MGAEHFRRARAQAPERATRRRTDHAGTTRSDLGNRVPVLQAALHDRREQHRQRYLDQRRTHRPIAARSGRDAMTKPVLGFAGMTHLGLVSGICAAEKGFKVICFDPDAARVTPFTRGEIPVSEPGLPALLAKNKERLLLTQDSAMLAACDVVYVAPDVPTDDQGRSDLDPIDAMLKSAFDATRDDAIIVVLSQVPPGFTRGRQRPGRILYYEVETLVFGAATERALNPERTIVGCADPGNPLPPAYANWLLARNCPVLAMRYESAELA